MSAPAADPSLTSLYVGPRSRRSPRISFACFDSVCVVTSPVPVNAPPSSIATTRNDATTTTIQPAMVRHGCMAHARATRLVIPASRSRWYESHRRLRFMVPIVSLE